MISYRTSPTKSNLLRFKEELKIAQEGYELLDRKREVLFRELMRLIYEIRRIQERISQKLSQIYKFYQKAEIKLGQERLNYIWNFKKEFLSVKVLERSVMGVHLPELHLETELKPVFFGPLHTPMELDLVMKMLLEIFPLLLHYLELKYALVRIATETKKTERRLRALENIFIPEYKNDIFRIEMILEENEREEFFRNKRVKNKIIKRNV